MDTTFSQPPTIDVGPYRVGPGESLLLIAGPCVIESESLILQIAERLKEICADLPVQLVFKASFDKANRTSLKSARGPGIEEGLNILAKVSQQLELPVTTDIHEAYHAAPAAEVCSLLQIPAFLCRQTDLLVAAAQTGRAVNVKKGQFVSPGEMKHVLGKLHQSNCANAMLCERGTFFGYGRLVNDMTALVEMRALGAPVVFDATHSVQRPGGADGTTGGNRAMVEPLARAAIAVGIDGLFFETHPEPDTSPSDGPNMIPLAELPDVLRRILQIRTAAENLS